MSFSNTFETHVLNYVFNATSVTRPTSWFLALFTAAPTDGSSGTEVTGGGYLRKAVALTVSGNTATNSGIIEYPTATANYGTVVAVGVFDLVANGTLIAYGSLSTNKTIETNDTLRVPASDITITLD